MINKKILVFFLLGIFLISFVVASDLDTAKAGDNVTLYQMCENCTGVNFTSMRFPNSSIIFYNLEMTKNGADFTLDFSDTSQVGDYQYTVCGDKNGGYKCEVIDFQLSSSGYSQSTSQGIGSFAYLALMIVLMFVFGWIGFRFFKTENWWIMGLFFEFFAFIFLIYNTFLGYQYHKYVTGLPSSGIPETLFYIFILIFVVSSLASIALLFRHWRKIIRYIKKEAKRKEEDDSELEDWDVDRWAGEGNKINRDNSWRLN